MGPLELLIIVAVVWLLPVFTLYSVAGSRGQSRRYAFWGLLSWLGLIVGLLVMIATPTPKEER